MLHSAEARSPDGQRCQCASLVQLGVSALPVFYFKKKKSVSVLKGATFRHNLTLPLPPPGFLHTPDGGHPAPTPSRPSPAVFSAPWAGHWGGSAYPPGTHSHSAGKATMTFPKKDMHMHTPFTTNNAISLLPRSPFFFLFCFVCKCSAPSLPHVVWGPSLFYTSYFSIVPLHMWICHLS